MSLTPSNTTFSIHNIINKKIPLNYDIYIINNIIINYHYIKNHKMPLVSEPSKCVLVRVKESYYNKTPTNRRYKECSPMGLGRCRK